MKRPSSAKQTKVTAETLVGLGAERLAEILASVAETRTDLKRRLRMELAAEHGPGPLAAHIDKRLNAFETSRGKVAWRQGPAFIRDVESVRVLLAERLAPLDPGAATERLWRFMDAARPLAARYRERHGELGGIFERAASDLGRLLAKGDEGLAASALVDSLTRNPSAWKAWLPGLLAGTSPRMAEQTLRFMVQTSRAAPAWLTLARQAADAAGDIEAYRATYSAAALASPGVAAELAQRYLAKGAVDAAGEVLRAAAPKPTPGRGGGALDPAWEAAWIDYLAAAGRGEEAQAVRWAAFERTLSPEPLRAYIRELKDFADVEAEQRAFEIAADRPEFEAGLAFLMDWPSLAAASDMIAARQDEAIVGAEAAERWAAKLRRRYPKAAHRLLRAAAAAAFRRREFKTCERLTAEAETIAV